MLFVSDLQRVFFGCGRNQIQKQPPEVFYKICKLFFKNSQYWQENIRVEVYF